MKQLHTCGPYCATEAVQALACYSMLDVTKPLGAADSCQTAAVHAEDTKNYQKL